MQRWKAYMASAEADRRAEAISPREQLPPEPPDSEFIGAPWFPETLPIADGDPSPF